MIELKQVSKNEFKALTLSMKGNDREEMLEAYDYFQDNFNGKSITLAFIEIGERNARCLGYVLSRLDGDERTISRIYVAEDQRGKGYASKLIKRIEESHYKIRIKCLENVKQFWQQQGYEINNEHDKEGYYVGYKQTSTLSR